MNILSFNFYISMFQNKVINRTTIERVWSINFYTSFSLTYEQFLKNNNIQEKIDYIIAHYNVDKKLEHCVQVWLPNNINNLWRNVMYMLSHNIAERFIFDEVGFEKLQKYKNTLLWMINPDCFDSLSKFHNQNSFFGEKTLNRWNIKYNEGVVNYFKNVQIKYSASYSNMKYLEYISLLYYSNFDELYLLLDIENFDISIVDSKNLWNLLSHKKWAIFKISLDKESWWKFKKRARNKEIENIIFELQNLFSKKCLEEIIQDCENYLNDPWIKKFSIEKEKNYRLVKKTVNDIISKNDNWLRKSVQDWYWEVLEKYSGWYKSTEITITNKKWKKDISI